MAARMSDEEWEAAKDRAIDSSGRAFPALDEADCARESEAALLGMARRMVRIPLRDCPWGCPDEGHTDSCAVTLAARLLAQAEGR